MKPGATGPASSLGTRIHVIGNSCSGKSTLASSLAHGLDAPLVELDALNWEPGWTNLSATDPAELERRIHAATAGEAWVVAGSYERFAQRCFWSRLDTVIWLDLPMPQLVARVLVRSFRRWRSRELLWGTNYEELWPTLMVWKKDESLLWWIVTQHQRKRQRMIECMADPRWRRIRFVRLTSSAEIGRFVEQIQAGPA